jgi:AraC-like DNA-binding protein
MNKLTNQLLADNQSSLKLLEDRMEGILTNIEYESLNLSINPLINDVMNKPALITNYTQISAILDVLDMNKSSNPFIDGILFYDRSSGYVISNSLGYVSLSNVSDKDDIESLTKIQDSAGRWIYLPHAQSRGSISFVRALPIMSLGAPQGILIINVNKSKLIKHMNSYATTIANQTFEIIDSSHRIMLNSLDSLAQPAGILALLAGEEPVTDKRIVRNEQDKSYFISSYNNAYGRTYVSYFPKNEIVKYLSWIRWFMFYSVIIFIFIGLLLAIICSKLAYKPILQLIEVGEMMRKGSLWRKKENELEFIKSCLQYLNEQAESLEKYLKKVEPNLRNLFLYELLTSSYSNKSSLIGECEIYGIPLQGRYQVLIVTLGKLHKEKKLLPNNREHLMMDVTNVMRELVLDIPVLNGSIVDGRNREGIAILVYDTKTPGKDIEQMTRNYAEKIHKAMLQYLSLTVSVGIGQYYPNIFNLHQSYAEAQLALQNQLIFDSNAVMLYDEILIHEKHSLFSYPKEMEQQIIDALVQDEQDRAIQLIHAFSQKVRDSGSYNTVFQCYHILLSSLIKAFEEIQPGFLHKMEKNPFEQLKNAETSREVYDWFIEQFFPLCRQMTEEISQDKKRELIRKVMNHVKENIGFNLSLTECAELAGMSPSYLSRLFKQESGLSFVDYLVTCKVERAKNLLKETDHTILEIAESVGYSERSLNRVFQRFSQMSPNQYRISNR